MLKYMLDTDICIYVIKRKPPHLKRIFNACVGQLCISSISYGELICGAEKSQATERNLRELQGFVARLEVLSFDSAAAQQFGQVKAELELSGGVIGAYDMMIAGQARSHGLILVTNNTREYMRVQGLRVENWLSDLP